VENDLQLRGSYDSSPPCSHITEEHFFFVKGTVAYSALARGILGEGGAMTVGERWYGPGRERLRLGV